MSDKLAGQAAVVTGSSKGIGAQIAKDLAAAGASVVVNYSSSRAAADGVVAEITKAGGKAVSIQADLSQPADVTRLFDDAENAFGKLTILVNNAGIYEFAPLAEITPEHFHKQFNLNVLGLLLATQAAVSHFGPDGGSIVNISSAVSTFTPPDSSVYSATKASVDAITRTLAKELGSRRIRVNAINPGMIETEGAHDAGITQGEMRQQIEQMTPAGRIGQVGDIGPAAVFLSSKDASYITGETLLISGGLR